MVVSSVSTWLTSKKNYHCPSDIEIESSRVEQRCMKYSSENTTVVRTLGVRQWGKGVSIVADIWRLLLFAKKSIAISFENICKKKTTMSDTMR